MNNRFNLMYVQYTCTSEKKKLASSFKAVRVKFIRKVYRAIYRINLYNAEILNDQISVRQTM